MKKIVLLEPVEVGPVEVGPVEVGPVEVGPVALGEQYRRLWEEINDGEGR